MSRRLKVVLGIVGGIVVVNALLALLASYTGGTPGGPRSSSYATGDDGLAAYASLVARAGHRVQRLREPASKAALDPRSTLVLLDPRFVTRDDAEGLRRFVTAGGRLVAGGERSDAWLRRVLPDGPRWSPGGAEHASPLAPVAELRGVRSVAAAGLGSWSSLGPALPALAGRERTLLAVAAEGLGRVLLLADASPLSNAFLAEADDAALGLGLAGERGRPVVFAESYHGYGKSSGVGAIPSRWKALLVLAGVAAAAFVLARGRRLGPAEPDRRTLPPPRSAYVEALSALIGKTRDRAAVAASLRARATALGGSAAELPSEDGLSSDEGLIATARALARLERNARRRWE